MNFCLFMINYNTKYIITMIEPYTVILLRCAFHRTSALAVARIAPVWSVRFFSHRRGANFHSTPVAFEGTSAGQKTENVQRYQNNFLRSIVGTGRKKYCGTIPTALHKCKEKT